jgi:drug/metabolite transporter (DMT)-like permease
MSDQSLSARGTGIFFLAVTVIGWALNWPAIKLLIRDWTPLFSRGLAGVAAAVILALIALARGENLRVPRDDLPHLAFAAFTNVFTWMGFTSLSVKWLTIGDAALLVYTMPIWAMIFAWPIRGTKPGPRDIAALCLAFSGVVVLVGTHGVEPGSNKIFGISFALGAAIFFALGSVIRRPLSLSPTSLVSWQVGLGCFPMMILGLIVERPNLGALSQTSAAALIYMTLFPMGLCYLTWFAALRRIPPGTAAMGTLAVPVLGIIAATLIFGEPLGIREVLSMILTLGGVFLALQKPVMTKAAK